MPAGVQFLNFRPNRHAPGEILFLSHNPDRLLPTECPDYRAYFTPQPYGRVCVTTTFSPACSFCTASRT